MKILITGGAGFIGSNFIRFWLKKHPQDKIVNLDKLTYAGHLTSFQDIKKNKKYTFVKGDIVDAKVVGRAMRGADIVVHFAAESHVDRSVVGAAVFVMTNVVGTQVLLDQALKEKIKRFHHVSCYDEKTRTLTKDGLKSFSKLSDKDEVLSLNLETREIEWKRIAEVIIQDYEGPMIQIKSDRIDLLVTPNHRILLQTQRDNLLFKEARNLGARNILPQGIWKSKHRLNKDFMYFLGFFIGDGFLAFQRKSQPNLTGLSKHQYLVLARDKKTGQFISVGRIGSQKETVYHSYRIFLDVPKNDKARQRVERTLTRLGVNWHAHSGKAGEHLYFTSKKLFKILEDCGKGAKNKKIPRWALEVERENLRALYEGLIGSDGRRTHNREVFSTSSQKLAENFSELCIKLGLTPHVFVRKSRSNSYNGRVIHGGDNYLITIAKTRRSIIPKYGLNHTRKVYYKGKIWCVRVPGNKNLLIERNGVFAFCGNTDEVFGSLPLRSRKKFNEKTLYAPNSPYAASKAGSDYLVRAYFRTYGLPVTITNTSNNYGPYQNPEKFLPRAITNLIDNEPIPIYGDGKYVRDWLYVEDHCRAIDVVLKKGKVGETYCVGGLTRDINNLEVAKRLLKIFAKDESEIKFVKDRPGHDRRYAVNWGKIRRELTWKPKYDFDTWLKKTVDWYRENKWWWRPLKKKAESLYQETGQK